MITNDFKIYVGRFLKITNEVLFILEKKKSAISRSDVFYGLLTNRELIIQVKSCAA